jgi:uncharacterized protein (DUF58 family)
MASLPQMAGESGQFPVLFWLILLFDCILLAIVAVDALLTIPQSQFSSSRTIGGTGSQGKKYEVEIGLVNRSKRPCRVTLRDDRPPGFEVTPEQFSVSVDGISNTRLTYDYVSDLRGRVLLKHVFLNVFSPLRLWKGSYKIPVESTVNVYPDIKQISDYDLLARTNRLSLLGVRRSRKIGQDNDFERLRDYTQDDNFKNIDWRSTARRQKLTVKDFQADQSQQIIFMIDCGRMMTGTHGKTGMIDHAINAMLMLSYVALRQGDSVGLITFSNKVHNFTPPKSGVKHINRLLHATFDQSASHVESRYDQAFLYLRSNCPKRSLVVTITNLIDEVNASQVQKYLSVLTGRHLPLAVLLRDHSMFDAVEELETKSRFDEQAVYQAAAAATILSWRHQVINDLKHHGVLTLDEFPERLTAGLVNRYLEVKARHLL